MSNPLTRLYTKNGIAAQKIAQLLIKVDEGQRIPRIDDFANDLKLGRGTIQASLKLLEEMDAIRLDARGHMGTFLVNKNTPLLWQIAGNGTIVGVMPLPYSRKYEGMATGFVDVFNKSDIPFNMAYMRGSFNRINALRTGRCDFAILSRWAAEQACERDDNLIIFKALGKHTYVGGHGVLFANKEHDRITHGMKVGIDRSSADQQQLTAYECEGLNVTYVDVNYMQLFQQLKRNDIDAAVWNLDEMHLQPELGIGKFHSTKARQLAHVISETAVVIEKHKDHVHMALQEISFDSVIDIQTRVEEGIKLPHY